MGYNLNQTVARASARKKAQNNPPKV